jgi:hypothetical protein
MALHPEFSSSPYELLEPPYRFVHVDQESFELHVPKGLAEQSRMFREYQPEA